jgi:hypothetical protein
MIRNGETITFDVQGTTGGGWPRTVAGVRQEVIDALTPFFEIQDVPIFTSSFLSDPFHSLSQWPYTSTVRATMQSDYADVRDVDSVIANAFYQATGELPTVTARGKEPGQTAADTRSGLSLTTALALVAVGLVAIAVVKIT